MLRHSLFFVLVGAASFLAGCGGDDAVAAASPGDAGVMDVGTVALRYADGQVSGLATFQPTSGAAATHCTDANDGACSSADCSLDATYDGTTSFDRSASAGTLTFGGGALADGSVTMPFADGHYAFATFPSPGAPWKANDPITVTAAGGTVPAFTASVIAPAPAAVLTTPNLSRSTAVTADRATSLAIAWTGATAGPVVWILQSATTARIVSTTCTFDGASGAAEVPATVLARFPAGTATAIFAPINTQKITSGSYKIGLSVQGSATNGTGTVDLR